MQHTPLYERHVALGAKLVDFAGWYMPLDYGSQIDEHHAVRRSAGIFDVSHMTLTDVQGDGASATLESLLAGDVTKLAANGTALYSCMLREDGGIIDDVIAYRTGPDRYRVVSNAATRRKDLDWMQAHMRAAADLIERTDLALLAVQGPAAVELVAAASAGHGARIKSLEPFAAADIEGMLVARTGYTGEDGCEIALDARAAPAYWDRLVALGVRPCGLGARDTLRLEAGLNLYGADMDEHVTPYECGLGWTVAAATGQDFIGRNALQERHAAGFVNARAGLVLLEPGVMRAGCEVRTPEGAGLITSGSYSPTLGRSVAIARLPRDAAGECRVVIRSRERRAKIVKLPFVRRGKIVVAV